MQLTKQFMEYCKKKKFGPIAFLLEFPKESLQQEFWSELLAKIFGKISELMSCENVDKTTGEIQKAVDTNEGISIDIIKLILNEILH